MAHDKSPSGSLLIKGGHLIDPAARIDAPMDILIEHGRVAEFQTVLLTPQTKGIGPLTIPATFFRQAWYCRKKPVGA